MIIENTLKIKNIERIAVELWEYGRILGFSLFTSKFSEYSLSFFVFYFNFFFKQEIVISSLEKRCNLYHTKLIRKPIRINT
ncbi:hypothetical protein D7Z94_21835 [Ulvibacterium marinum]|uniref:Uncharacterized protein n=1 Tax=Ulvibacterium marinum TaxID=2419782 RepID=A0A3B0C0M7_9FLAO|nr:hypothetical protein D7Z94_21835 [Ulvibacterium marinum]